MELFLKILTHLPLLSGVLCVHQVSQLPCQFIDEHVFLDKDNLTETQLIHREALLQFGQKGDAPLNSYGITFLVTGSKLDLRRYVEEVEAEQMECEIRRYSTEGVHVRWPVKGEQEYSRWYTCSLRHVKNLFAVTGVLRQTSDQPPTGKQDYLSWLTIEDKEILTTTVAMVMKTLSPSVKSGLRSKQRLHCQFAVDHKAPQVTVEWYRYLHGQKITLFNHSSQTGQTQGSGVELRGIRNGDASFTVPLTDTSSEGKYVCSVSVNPVSAIMDVHLQIKESPQVSLNVGSTLSLQEDEELKVICTAENYYPLDVEVVWFSEDLSDQRVGVPRSKVPHSLLHSSHKSNRDKTHTRSSFFYLKASSRDSGRRFTCSVFHQSLGEPINVSFTLRVTGKYFWFWVVFLAVDVFLLVVSFKLMPHLCSRRRRSHRSDPY